MRFGRAHANACALAFLLVSNGGCDTHQRIPLSALALSESSLAIRNVQSRRFEVHSEDEILAASIAVLQDMEFNIDEIAKPLGVLSASKVADASSSAEDTQALVLDILCVLSGSGGCNARSKTSDQQKIMLTLVVLPSLARQGDYVARVTLQRVVFDQEERVKLREQIEDPAIYQEIFANLSKSIALEELQ